MSFLGGLLVARFSPLGTGRDIGPMGHMPVTGECLMSLVALQWPWVPPGEMAGKSTLDLAAVGRDGSSRGVISLMRRALGSAILVPRRAPETLRLGMGMSRQVHTHRFVTQDGGWEATLTLTDPGGEPGELGQVGWLQSVASPRG